MAQITCENLKLGYDGREILRNLNFSVNAGDYLCIVGENGSGKSTFAKILAGILNPDKSGRVVSGGSVGYMPQKNYAYRMSTKTNILLNGKDKNRANALMDAIQIRHLENKRADKLSGGETARMALVRLMMKRYDVVLLDEPTAAMDMETTLLSEKLIVEYVRETGCALVLARFLRFIRLLIREDFPTLLLPAKAISIFSFSGNLLVIPQTVSRFTSLIIITISSGLDHVVIGSPYPPTCAHALKLVDGTWKSKNKLRHFLTKALAVASSVTAETVCTLTPP